MKAIILLVLLGAIRDLLLEIEKVVLSIRERAVQGSTNPIQSGEKEYLDRLRASVHLRIHLAKAFRRAAYTTGGLMAVSVAVIPFVQVVDGNNVLSVLLLAMGVVGFAVCLYMFWAVIETAVYKR
jgi:hypothetical protein